MRDDADHPVPTLLGEVVYFVQLIDLGKEGLSVVGVSRDECMQDHSEAAFSLRLLDAVSHDEPGTALGL